MLKRAANKAMNLHPKIDYLVSDGEIIIIDQSTHYQKKGSHLNQYVHEMLHIKENIQVDYASHPIMQITQHAYFNLYKKIIGVTGTIGSEDDEKLLMEGYKVNIFKFPRNRVSQLEVYLKKRPDSIQNIFDMVSNEITKETNNGRPVIVIWDSIKCAEDFLKSHEYLNAQKITAEDVTLDRCSIKNACNAKSVTVATLAVGRGVDIIVSNESLEAGGLHVIIPMPMRNQRSLEQAVGRTGRQGQPGSVSIYISNDDQYEKNPQFVGKDENLLNIELEFWEYMKTTYKWMLIPLTYDFPQEPIFPFGADYKAAMKILSKYIVLYIYRSTPLKDKNPKNIIEIFRNLSLRMTQISWLFFFNQLCNDENVNEYEHCKDLYNDFIKELNDYFPQNKNNVQNENDEINAQNVLDYMKNLISLTDDDVVYESGIKITASLLDVIYSQDSFLEKVIRYIFNFASPLIKSKISWQKFTSGSLLLLKLVLISKGYLRTTVQMNGFNSICYYFNGLCEIFSKKKEAKFPTFKNVASNLGKNTANLLIPDKTVKKKIHYENKISLLTNDFIRKTMNFAKWIYDKYQSELDQYKSSKLKQLEFPKPVIDIFTPYFYCKDELDTRYVLIKGTSKLDDAISDISCKEIIEKINGKSIHFHYGFYKASVYIYEKIIKDLGKFEKIYFVGHSYGASIASILCLLAKSNKDLSDKEIYAMAFAPAPAMSYCPEDIADCIFVFINHHDPIPRCCAYNISKALDYYKSDRLFLFIKEGLEKFDFLKDIFVYIKVIADLILNGWIDVQNTQVRTVKGVIFSIGLFETGNLNECRILDENDIGDEINIDVQNFMDHKISNYIQSFDKYFA